MGFKMKGFSEHQTTDLTKKPTGPRATPKKSKEVAGDVDLSPGYEDPMKIQKVQREGLTPHSQKFSKIAKANTKKVDPDAPGTPGQPGYEPPVRREDLDEKGKAIWDKHRSPNKHYVDDVKEHNEDGHPDNLQGPEEHKQWKAKKPKKSTKSAHGQLEDAQTEYETDKKILKKKSPNKQKSKKQTAPRPKQKPDKGLKARKKGDAAGYITSKDYKVHSKSGKVEKMGLGGTKVTSNKKQFGFGGSPAKIDPPKDSDRYGNTTRGETKKKMKAARKASRKAKTSEGKAKASKDYYKAMF